MLTFLSTSILSANPENLAQTAKPKQEVWVNVFVHGIMYPVVTIGDMVKISRQKLKQSRYKHITKYVRKNTVIHRSQALQGIGLEPIKMEPNPNNNGSRAMVAVFKKLNQYDNKPNCEHDLYYTFGWSGLLSYKSRQRASRFLYEKLIRLVDQLKAKGVEPKLRIISFSHGGNVSVQMANFDPWNKLRSKLTVDELITLGMPIQRENDVLIRHPMFEKVYHFYSIGDIPQTLDFVSTDFTASHRYYQARKCFAIPDKLTQVQVQFSKTNRYKQAFTYNPTHIEMWSFGWVPTGYHKKSPLFPFPAAAFATYLVNTIRKNPELSNNLIANIYPDQEKIIFTNLRWKRHSKINQFEVPFLSKQNYNELKQTAWTRRPAETADPSGKKIVNDAIYFATRQRKLHRHCNQELDCQTKSCSAMCSN